MSDLLMCHMLWHELHMNEYSDVHQQQQWWCHMIYGQHIYIDELHIAFYFLFQYISCYAFLCEAHQ